MAKSNAQLQKEWRERQKQEKEALRKRAGPLPVFETIRIETLEKRVRELEQSNESLRKERDRVMPPELVERLHKLEEYEWMVEQWIAGQEKIQALEAKVKALETELAALRKKK